MFKTLKHTCSSTKPLGVNTCSPLQYYGSSGECKPTIIMLYDYLSLIPYLSCDIAAEAMTMGIGSPAHIHKTSHVFEQSAITVLTPTSQEKEFSAQKGSFIKQIPQ